MLDFQHKFTNKIEKQWQGSTTPVANAIPQIYQSHLARIQTAVEKNQEVESKNQRMATANLNYRHRLSKKIQQDHQKHAKKRRQQLNKIVKAEERKLSFKSQKRQEHQRIQKQKKKQQWEQFKEKNRQATEFWQTSQLVRQKKYKSQSNVKFAYDEVHSRKISMQNIETRKSQQVKIGYLKRQIGKKENKERLVNEKKQYVHEIHNREIENILQKNEKIMKEKEEKYINSIGDHFRSSSELLKMNCKILTKKIDDKQKDDQIRIDQVKKSMIIHQRNKSAGLSDCKCKRINNVEQDMTKSLLMKESLRKTLFTDTIQKLEKSSSSLTLKRSQFMEKNQNLLSSVLYNKSKLQNDKEKKNFQKLNTEKQITDAIKTRRKLQDEANCDIRKANSSKVIVK